jgi:hypothetical protein
MIWYTTFGIILTITYAQRNNISTLVRSNGNLLKNFVQPVVGTAIVVAFGAGYQGYQLYSQDWEYVFVNRLNETIGIAAEHSIPWNDFFSRSSFHELTPYTTGYVCLQPRSNALLGYTYRFAIQRGKSLLLIPADFSDNIPKTF